MVVEGVKFLLQTHADTLCCQDAATARLHIMFPGMMHALKLLLACRLSCLTCYVGSAVC